MNGIFRSNFSAFTIRGTLNKEEIVSLYDNFTPLRLIVSFELSQIIPKEN